jgi:hypothetical protein
MNFLLIMFGFCSCRYQSSLWAYIPSISKTILPAIFLNLHSTKQVVSIMHMYIFMETITKIHKVIS